MKKHVLAMFLVLTIPCLAFPFSVTGEEKVPLETQEKIAIDIKYIGTINAKGILRLMSAIDTAIRSGAENINIVLSSTGGDSCAGIAAYNYIKGLPSSIKVKTHNLSTVASAAILVYCAGSERSTSPIAQFLVHQATNDMNGRLLTAGKFRETAGWMESYNDMSQQIISSCTTKEKTEVEKAHFAGATFDSKEAKEWGLAHTIEHYVFNEKHMISYIESE